MDRRLSENGALCIDFIPAVDKMNEIVYIALISSLVQVRKRLSYQFIFG